MTRIGLIFCWFALVGCVKMLGPFQYEHIPDAPGLINHVVFFDLKDPSNAEELVFDCGRLLEIPGVTSGYFGRHIETGRESVLVNYDVGFFVAFGSVADYENYLAHPKHIALVEKWEPRWESIRVYDVQDFRTWAWKNQ